MRLILFPFLLILFGFAPLSLAIATTLPQPVNQQNHILLTPFFSMFEDSSGALTRQEALQKEFIALDCPSGCDVYSTGFTQGSVWLKLKFRTGSEAKPMLLEQKIWYNHKLEAWLYQGQGVQYIQTGSGSPKYKQDTYLRSLVLPLELQPDLDYELLLRLESQQLVEFNLTLWESHSFWREQGSANQLSAMFFAALLCLFLYNALLAYGIGHKSFLWYGAYLLCLLFNLSFLAGYWSRVFFVGHAQEILWLYPLMRIILMLVVLRFIQSFSLSASRCPKWHKASNYALVPLLPILGSMPFLSLGVVQVLISLQAVVVIPFSFLLAAVTFRQGHRESRFVVYATAWYAVMNMLLIPRQFGWVPTPQFGLGLGEILVLIDVGLFGVAMADKFKVLRKERSQALEALLEQAQGHAEQLEGKVAHRTAELKTSQLELQKANQTKDQFFSILAHDLRGPIGALNTTLDILSSGKIKPDPELLNSCADSTKQVHNLLESLLGWAQSQQGVLVPKPVAMDVQLLLGHVKNLAAERAQQKDITLVLEAAEGITLVADEMMLQTVIRNLLSNALKFTPRGGSISLSGQQQNGKVVLEVADAGVGMSPEALEHIFELGSTNKSALGTDQEVGSGFGLVLVKEFVEKNGGQIEAYSELGQGSRFLVHLPLPQVDRLES